MPNCFQFNCSTVVPDEPVYINEPEYFTGGELRRCSIRSKSIRQTSLLGGKYNWAGVHQDEHIPSYEVE